MALREINSSSVRFPYSNTASVFGGLQPHSPHFVNFPRQYLTRTSSKVNSLGGIAFAGNAYRRARSDEYETQGNYLPRECGMALWPGRPMRPQQGFSVHRGRPSCQVGDRHAYVEGAFRILRNQGSVDVEDAESALCHQLPVKSVGMT